MIDPELKLVENIDDAMELRRWLGERRDGPLAADTETSGLEWWRDRLRLVQFGDKATGWAVPAEDWRGFLRDIVRDYEGEWVFANRKFDEHQFAQHLGVVPKGKVHDIACAGHIVDSRPVWEGGPGRGLKSLASKYVDPRAAAGGELLAMAMSEAKWDWGTVPINGFTSYWAYGALDPVLTAHVHGELRKKIVSAGQTELYELECAVADIIRRMEERGVRVDLEYARHQEAHRELWKAVLRKWTREEYGFDIAGEGANEKIKEYLLGLGWEPTVFTDSGSVSLSAEALEPLGHPLARAVLQLRECDKMAHTYLRNIHSLAEGDILHPDVDPLGALTGRMSVKRPSLQNLPRGPEIRDAFIAREGRRLLLIDYDQIELRLLVHWAQEPTLARALHAGEDPHMTAARQIYGAQAGKLERQKSKTNVYAKIYGAGIDQFAKTAGISVDAARDFMRAYDAALPAIAGFQQRVQQVGLQRARDHPDKLAWVRGWGNRTMVTRPHTAYRLVNYLLQSEAATVLKRKMVALDLVGLTEYLVLPVHDEVVLDVPEALTEDVRQEAIDVLTDRETYSVPLTVAASPPLGRWGDKYRVAA